MFARVGHLLSWRWHQGLFQRDCAIPGGCVVVVGYVDLEILLDQLVAKADTERLQACARLVVGANAVGPNEKHEVRDNGGSVRRFGHLHAKKLAGERDDDRTGPGVDHCRKVEH
jgi:hypothetical protein